MTPPDPAVDRAPDALTSRLAAFGAGLGMIAGLLELTIGASIRDWVGNKQDTTRLGLATLALSGIAVAASAALRGPWPRAEGSRVTIALGLLIPGLVCLTTVGRLWYPSAALLITAGTLVLVHTGRAEFSVAFDQSHWQRGLLIACGALYVFLGASAEGLAGASGIVGGVIIACAARALPAAPSRSHMALLLGALPFAVLTWWSVATPLLAVLVIALGITSPPRTAVPALTR